MNYLLILLLISCFHKLSEYDIITSGGDLNGKLSYVSKV